MELTKKKAIELTLKMWRDLAETGETKDEWFARHPEYEEIYLGCFLCEYGKQFKPDSICDHCPYAQKFIGCLNKADTPFFKWGRAATPKTRKKYAALFVKQLEEL